MTNEEHNQRRQQTEVSTNSDANDTASERQDMMSYLKRS